jgi:S1-C subfamily serine protease
VLRFLALTAGLAIPALFQRASADDAISPETVDAVKKATVFIRVQGDGWAGSGSGFVVHADAAGVLIATNDHVAAPAPPPGARLTGKPAVLTVVFDSGTKAERSYSGAVLAADPDRDLAVLRVGGVKDPPKPIPYADPPKWVETTPVYSFGFPFGSALSTTKGFPAVTVGKGSISSLRTGDDGELAVVQIEGNLNPGNSGGPVVDGKGRLVGVAVATVRDGRGIGLTVPGIQLARMMDGRLGWVRANAHKRADGSAAVRVFAELIDPAGSLRAPVVHYVVAAPGAKRSEGTALDKHPGSRRAEMKTDGGVASTEFTVPAAEGDVLVQVTAERAAKTAAVTLVRVVSLAPPPKVADPAGPPPPGWKVYTPRGRAFAMWVPANALSQGEEESTVTIAGEQVTVIAVDGRTAGGLAYEGESILLPAALANRPAKELHDLIRGDLLTGIRGRVVEARVVEMGAVAGEEYLIQSGPLSTRARVFVSGPRAYLVRVTGTADQLARKEADILLAAFHVPGPAKAPAVVATPKAKEVVVPRGRDPVVVGGGSAPLFKDVAPASGLLVGLELGLGKFGGEDVIKAVRPIYRVGDKEQLGTQRGALLTRVTTIKAKDGYAVGAITYRFGLNFDGCSLTFMRVAGGTLDPTDSYESEWVGYVGRKTPSKLGGDGTPVVGIVGRAGDKEVNGLGLLFKGQEAFDASPPRVVAQESGVAKDPTILGGYTNNTFKDAAPDGGLLVGFEFGLVKPFGREVIRGVRPIFRVGGKETLGEQHGAAGRTATVKAKEGYAVGRVTARHFGAFEGCSVTFMKVVDGKLDAADSYESEWVGSDEANKTLTKLGDGTPVIGVVGRVNDKEMVAMGVLFKGQERFTPKR